METIIKKIQNTDATQERTEYVVEITGRLSTKESDKFLEAIQPLLAEENSIITMDLTGMEYIASSGIRCFVLLLKNSKQNGTTLRLKNMQTQVKEIFVLTSLYEQFEVI